VWYLNVFQEEKQRAKAKEKLDKCIKEKLIDFCDVLDIPVNKSTVKKVSDMNIWSIYISICVFLDYLFIHLYPSGRTGCKSA